MKIVINTCSVMRTICHYIDFFFFSERSNQVATPDLAFREGQIEEFLSPDWLDERVS